MQTRNYIMSILLTPEEQDIWKLSTRSVITNYLKALEDFKMPISYRARILTALDRIIEGMK